MKTTLLVCLLGLALAGCSKYQYAVVDTAVEKRKGGLMVVANDSLEVVYEFSGLNGPATVTIHNKLDIPMYVNWQRSSIIIGGESVSRANETMEFNTSVSGMQIQWSETVSSIHQDVYGTITQSPRMGFIPPRSFIASRPIYLNDRFLAIPKKSLRKRYVGENSMNYRAFGRDESPLPFRSYVTVSFDPDFKRTVVFDDEFWVSEVAETLSGPISLVGYTGRKDVFYVKKITGFGVFAATLGVIGAVALSAAGE